MGRRGDRLLKILGDPRQLPLTLRFLRAGEGSAAGGMEGSAVEIRRGFSVLLLSPRLGLSFDLCGGVLEVASAKPIFTAPRPGDVLTAVNGTELAKCGLTVAQLALMLKALPRPLKLSFVAGGARAAGPARPGGGGELKRTDAGARLSPHPGPTIFPEHFLRHVELSPQAWRGRKGARLGVRLVTVSGRPMVQAVTSKALRALGVRTCDVIVSVDDRLLGDCTAVGEIQKDKTMPHQLGARSPEPRPARLVLLVVFIC